MGRAESGGDSFPHLPPVFICGACQDAGAIEELHITSCGTQLLTTPLATLESNVFLFLPPPIILKNVLIDTRHLM